MPFKSEAQRRYLWANEPEIARDWTDTYGSRIQKNTGGISQLVKSSGNGKRPGYQGPPGGGDKEMHYSGPSARERGMGSQGKTGQRDKSLSVGPSVDRSKVSESQQINHLIATGQEEKLLPPQLRPPPKLTPREQAFTDFQSYRPPVKLPGPSWLTGPAQAFSDFTTKRNRAFFENVIRAGKIPGLSFDMTQDEFEDAYQDYMSDRMSGKIDAYGNPNPGYGRDDRGPQQPDYMNDPAYLAWLRSQQGGTDEVEEEVIEEGGGGVAGTVYPYQFYGQPGYETSATFESYLAKGGRVPAAFGGIMDTNTGRRAYGLGSIFKSVGKAVKGVAKAAGKVLKSPVGLAALGFAANAGWLPGGFGTGMFSKSGGIGKLFTKKGLGQAWDPWKLGGTFLTAAPFLGIGTKAKQDTLGVADRGGKLVDPLTKEEVTPAQLRSNLSQAIEAAGDDEIEIAKINAAYPFLNLGIPYPYENYAVAKDGGRIGFAAGGMDFYTDEEGNYREGAFKEKAKEIGGSYDKGLLDFGAGENMVFDLMHKKYELGLSMEEAISALEKEWEEKIESGWYKPGQTNIGDMGIKSKDQIREKVMEGWDMVKGPTVGTGIMTAADGGRIRAQEGGLMDLGGMEKDYRNNGGFVAIGGEERADDVPARLSRNEFVFTADAVRGAGGGDIDKGAEIMENVMKNLEQGGKISQESQGNTGAQEMFSVSERIGEVL